MCSRSNCNQSAYFESKEGECYFHWKVRQGLMGQQSDYMTKADIQLSKKQRYWKTRIFEKYQDLAMYVASKTKGVSEADRPDLAQTLLTKLWSVSQQVDTGLNEEVIYSMILTSLLNTVTDFRRADKQSTSVEIPDDLYADGDTEEIINNKAIKYIITNLLNIYLNNLDTEDRYIFIALHLASETIPVRTIGDDLGVSAMSIVRRGRKLFEGFKEYVTQQGYTVADFF